jgi:hypothetical protein
MPIADDEILTALAIPRPAATPGAPPSAANLVEWTATAATVEEAARLLRQAGFTVEAAGAGALRVSGRAQLFQTVFRVVLEYDERGGVRTAAGSPDLPLEALPARLRAVLYAAGFEQPPDFGPGSFA